MRYPKKDIAEARENLLKWCPPGTTVYTILDHVSRSGMSRQIRVVVPYVREDGTVDHVHPNYAVAAVLGLSRAKRGDGVIMNGCGMDMGFALVHELSYALYGRGTGYACLGKGKCPSSYHNNHHDTIKCEGTIVHNPDGPNSGQYCCTPGGLFSRHDAPAGWPRHQIEIDGETIDGGPLACLHWDTAAEAPPEALRLSDGSACLVCPTCKGAGRLPNPAGPERFDLRHEDGYALRHKWL